MTKRQKALTKLKAHYEKKAKEAERAKDYKTMEEFSLLIMGVEKLEEADMG